jgi:predicted Zn-dependent protease with MMP-like domain
MLPTAIAQRKHPMVEFSELVGRAMGQLPEAFVERLDAVEVLSLNTPMTEEHFPPSESGAPLLGSFDPVRKRIYLYRWPLMVAARREKKPLKDLVADRLVYELAGLWGMPPEQIDPRFGQPR